VSGSGNSPFPQEVHCSVLIAAAMKHSHDMMSGVIIVLQGVANDDLKGVARP
jgi:hypothetical protein